MQNENANQSTKRVEQAAMENKKLNIIVHGVPEADNKNLETTVTDLLNEAECMFG